MNTLEIAQDWINKGYSIIPITYRSKRPAFDALRATGSIIDGDISWSMYKERQATAHELKVWFNGPKRNLAIVSGYNGLVVLDFDTIELYAAWVAWSESAGSIAAACQTSTYRVYSARGVHVYLTVDEDVESFQLPGIDIKSKWGYVLAPPSIHPSGHQYRGVGEGIVHCERLSDVFPLVKPEPAVIEPITESIVDPWEAAANAVVCGGQGAIERIHSRLSVADMLGINLNGRKSVLVHCPLHNDKNPSMLVYADSHCCCLAGCNEGRQMDIIDLYAALHRITNREAIAILSQVETI